MPGTFVLFPQMAAAPATLPDGWDDPAIIAQLSPELQTQLRREVRQMAEWNRRAALMKGVPSATGEAKASAEDAILRINRWFADMAWIADVDATLQPISTSIDPVRVAALAKLAGQAAQQIAAINTFVDAVNTATLLANALRSEGGAIGSLAQAAIMSADLGESLVMQAQDAAGLAPPAPSSTGKPANSNTDGTLPPSGGSNADLTALKARLELISTQVTANEAAIKVALGTIAGSGEGAGKLTLGDSSGLLESTLLAADTLGRCAGMVRNQIIEALGEARPPIIVAGADMPDVSLWRAVQGRVEGLAALAERAESALASARQAFGDETDADIGAAFAITPVAAAVTAVGTIVSNVANLASYFQTSWTTKGFSIEGVDDGLFGRAVASTLIDGQFEVYTANSAWDEPTALKLFDVILGHRQTGERVKATAEALQKTLIPAQPGQAGVTGPDLLARATSAGAAIGVASAVLQACDGLITNLTTPNAAGISPLTGLSAQAALGSLLDQNALILQLKVHKSLGGLYTKEEGKIRAWFRSQESDTPDLHVSGGAVVSFELLSGGGRIITAGTLRDQTEYLQLDHVDGWLENGGHAQEPRR